MQPQLVASLLQCAAAQLVRAGQRPPAPIRPGWCPLGALAELAEHNCLKMHSVMMTTRPPLMYWSPVTLACMQKIMELRADGVPVFFTVDAGPQVKAVCEPGALADVVNALHDIPGVIRVIAGALGDGASVTGRD